MNVDTSELRYTLKDDLCIVGNNPEMADMGNPRGELEGLAHYIVAEAPDGRRFAHDAWAYTCNGYAVNGPEEATYEEVDGIRYEEDLTTWTADSRGMTVERLKALAAYLNAHTPSLDAAHWTEVQACYGSEAYQRDGWEGHAISLEIDEAADAGEISRHDAARLKVERGCLS